MSSLLVWFGFYEHPVPTGLYHGIISCFSTRSFRLESSRSAFLPHQEVPGPMRKKLDPFRRAGVEISAVGTATGYFAEGPVSLKSQLLVHTPIVGLEFSPHPMWQGSATTDNLATPFTVQEIRVYPAPGVLKSGGGEIRTPVPKFQQSTGPTCLVYCFRFALHPARRPRKKELVAIFSVKAPATSTSTQPVLSMFLRTLGQGSSRTGGNR